MLDAVQGFVSVHGSAIIAAVVIVAIGAGVFGYGRYHERRTRGRGPGLTG